MFFLKFSHQCFFTTMLRYYKKKPLYRPGTHRRLEQRDETGNEKDGTQNLADVLGFLDAHFRCDNQRDAEIGAKTRQAVLQPPRNLLQYFKD